MAEAPLTRSIATRTGDDGTTSLLYGQRVLKNHPQIEAVGVLDELNAALGFAKATRPTGTSGLAIEQIQRELVGLMGELSCAPSDAARYAAATFAKIDGWATPGANVHAAALDLARTTARRAERQLVGLGSPTPTVRPVLLRYINRVSDLLWLMAREAEQV